MEEMACICSTAWAAYPKFLYMESDDTQKNQSFGFLKAFQIFEFSSRISLKI